MTKRRIFVAIKLPDNIKAELDALINPFAKLPIRILTPDKWHITLAFLGWLDSKELNTLEQILEKCLADELKLDLEIKNISWGPVDRRPRMIWANLDLLAEYKELVDCLEKELLQHQKKENSFRQFRPGRRPLKAHITLARFREEQWHQIEKQANKLELTMPNYFEQFSVNKIHIMESHLSRAGAEYQIIKSYELQK